MNIRVPEVLLDCSRLPFSVNIGPVAKTNLPNFAGDITLALLGKKILGRL
jgi:hypothetical protein